jgi:hypothetical protein
MVTIDSAYYFSLNCAYIAVIFSFMIFILNPFMEAPTEGSLNFYIAMILLKEN